MEATERERMAVEAHHSAERASATAVCRATPDRCQMDATQRRQRQEIATASKKIAETEQALQRLYEAERQDRMRGSGQREAKLQDINNRREPLDTRLQNLNQQIDAIQAELDGKIRVADKVAADAEAARRTSQMHRMAKFFFNAEDNTAATRMLAWFSIVAAIVLSTSGSILAAMHFRTLTQPVSGGRTACRELYVDGSRGSGVSTHRQEGRGDREVEVPVERIVVRSTEVVKPELVLVPVPLEATEEERRRIMERAAHVHETDFGNVASINARRGA